MRLRARAEPTKFSARGEEDGELYVVRNELVNKDGMLLDAVVLYFDRDSKGKK